jgi:hypothetical protein
MTTSRYSLVLAAALAAFTLGACAFPRPGTAPWPLSAGTVDAAHTRWPDSTKESLEMGREVFVANCSRCHSYPDFSSLPDSKWEDIVPKMGKKAHLVDEDTGLVLRFILASRK